MSSDLNTVIYLSNLEDLLYRSLGLFIIIISTIGNFFNCFVFLRISPLNKHPNALFVIGSSIGSLFFINIGLSSAAIRVFSGIDPSNRWLFWCKTGTWLTYSAGCFSFMCNCFAAFGQFLITLPNIRWQRLITRLRTQLVIFSTAIIWLLIFLPLPIFYVRIPTSSIPTFTCTASHSLIKVYGTYWIIIGYYFLPIILTLILFCLTWYNLRKLLRRHRTLDGAVTRMMLNQMSTLLISGIPAGIFLSYLLATQYSSKTLLRLAYEYLILFLLTLFTYLTNGISFWVYLFVSKTFRKHLKEYISNWKLFEHRIKPVDMSTTRTNAANELRGF